MFMLNWLSLDKPLSYVILFDKTSVREGHYVRT